LKKGSHDEIEMIMLVAFLSYQGHPNFTYNVDPWTQVGLSDFPFLQKMNRIAVLKWNPGHKNDFSSMPFAILKYKL